MRKMRNTLYVLTPDSYLSLDGENIVLKSPTKEENTRIPLLNIEEILCLNYRGMSPKLMGVCMDKGIDVSFITPNGKFLARIQGPTKGNVYLRIEQYQKFTDPEFSLHLAKICISGKIYNSRKSILRSRRDHPFQVDIETMQHVENGLFIIIQEISEVDSSSSLRALEGEAAKKYFSVFNELLLHNDAFVFENRNRRPPVDEINSLLSLTYSLLTKMVVSACEAVGLDPYIGFFHVERPGRASLALDLIEELRPVMADRFVIGLINKRIFQKEDFETSESGAVSLKESSRKRFFSEWQKKKSEEVQHPFLKEKIPWGLIPYVQASLLAKFIRGDLDDYPVFLWRG